MSRTPSSRCEVLVVGEYFCDLIFAGLNEVPKPGAEFFAESLTVRPGGCYTMALALTRLGVDAQWACDFGTDLFSRAVLESARADGIGEAGFNRLDREVQRVSAAFSHHGERGFISFSETKVEPPDIALLDRLRPNWLLQSFRFDPGWLDFLRAAKARGVSIFADCRHGDFTLATPGVREFLLLCDVFSPNEAEALALTGEAHLDAALARLMALTPAVVIKRGARGAMACDDARIDIPAQAVAVVDTVGAGDAFNAGFLYGQGRGEDFETCARLAVACGTLSTLGTGGGAVPDEAALIAFAARQALAAAGAHRRKAALLTS